MGPARQVVLELGAGTGKLTRALVDLGHDVHATDPDPAMLAVLAEHLPQVRRAVASAEEIPLPRDSVDVVVAAQSFHWFDPARALPEIARVLVPGGHLALVWNRRDDRVPWVRRLGELMESPEPADAVRWLTESTLFEEVERTSYPVWQDHDRASMLAMVASHSYVAALRESERSALLSRIGDYFDQFSRAGRLRLPYQTHCYRAMVTGDAGPTVDPASPEFELPLLDWR